jgi:PAS domain S-box-containing protein
MNTPLDTPTGSSFREQAERLAREQAANYQHPGDLTEQELADLLHELRVRQIALELQNEQLRKAETLREHEAMHVSEARLRVIIEQMADAVIVESRGVVRFVNPATEEMFGRQASELIDCEMGLPVVFDGKAEVDILSRSNNHIIAEMRVVEVKWEGVTSSLATFRDITARKQLEEELEQRVEDRTAMLQHAVNRLLSELAEREKIEHELRESEERFRTVADYTYDWEYWISPQGDYLYISPSCERITGYAPQEFEQIPNLLETIIHPDDREWVAHHLRHEMATEPPFLIEFRIMPRGGGERWIGHACQSVYGSDGRWLGRRANNRDITRQKHAEEEVRTINAMLEQRVIERTAQLEHANSALLKEIAERTQAEDALKRTNRDLQHGRDLMHTIIDGINDGLLLLDHNGTVLEANLAIANLFGCASETLHSCEGLEHLMIHDDCDTLVPPCKWALRALEDGQPLQRRERFHRPDGMTRILDVKALPIVYSTDALEDPGSEPGHESGQVVLHVVDVTEPLKLEALMIENERLNTARKLTEIVAHEVNTPLQTIISSLDMMQHASKAKRASYLALAEQEIERIGTILHHLKDTYHLTYSETELVDINNLVQRVLLLTGGRMAKLHIQVEHHLDTQVVPVHSRADELIQVVLNIVINAIESMQEGGGSLRLCTMMQDSNLVIEISDTGRGIGTDVLPCIFEPFFTTKDEGSGLGLFVCHNIITRYGGTIAVQSQPGEGTTFRIVLPCRANPSG